MADASITPTVSDEAEEAQRAAQSPLALRFDLIGCEYAAERTASGHIIPEYTFNSPCIRGKSRPDQDCRDCIHVKIKFVGGDLPRAAHRYHRHGLVIPLTETQADDLITTLEADDATPLRRPEWESAASQAEEIMTPQERLQRELEQQQAGLLGTIPIRHDQPARG